MLVVRESNVPYIEAFSLDECYEEVALKELTASESGIKVIEALQEIINDLNSVPHLNSNEILGDVHHLLHLISYFINWPLLAGRQAYTNLCTRGGKKKQLSDEHSCCKKAYNDLWDNLYESTFHQLLAWDSPSTLLTQFTKHNTKVEIPRLGVIELLLRIVAESENSNDLDRLHTKFKELQVSKLDLTSQIIGYRGIPAVVALCAPRKPSQNGPNVVITTTTDVWTGIPSMHAFLRDTRQTRQDYNPFAAHSDDIQLILDETRYLHRKYPKGCCVMDTVSGQGNFCHQDSSLRALKCPEFDLKSRCVRCQGLFDYHIETHYKGVEWQDGMRSKTVVNDGTSCAEVYAHFYCKQELGEGNWVQHT